MSNKISKEFLQEHFRKHDSMTLYKPDGTCSLHRGIKSLQPISQATGVGAHAQKSQIQKGNSS